MSSAPRRRAVGPAAALRKSGHLRGHLGAACVASALLAAPRPAGAQQTVVLANGSQLNGRLAGITDKTWLFRVAGVEVQLALDSIASLLAFHPIGVRLRDGTVLAAAVLPAGDSLNLVAVGGPPRRTVLRDLAAVGSADDLEALQPHRLGWFWPPHKFWRATGSLGFRDQRGNSRARGFVTGLLLERKTAHDRIELAGGVAQEQGQVAGGRFETTASKAYVSARLEMAVSPRVFLSAGSRQERDRFQDIDLRSTYTGGLGYHAVVTQRTELRVSLLGGFRTERYASAGELSRPILSLTTAFRRTLGLAVLAWRVDWDPDAGNYRDYRLRSNASLTTRIYKGLGFRLESLMEYNSRPRPGIENHDLLTTATLTYSVGS